MASLILSEEQEIVKRFTLDALLNTGARQVVVGGVAGSGKSTIVNEIVHTLLPFGIKISVGAPTGKAAMVLNKKGVKAQTLHSILYYPVIDEMTGNVIDYTIKQASEYEFDLLVCDESSMIGRDIYDDIIGLGKQILFVGDAAQLPPIDDTGFSIMHTPDIELTNIHRVAANNPIIQLSKIVREKGILRSSDFRNSSSISFTKMNALTVGAMRNIDPEIILCGYRKTRDKMNTLMRTVRGFYDQRAEVGEIIICEKNCIANVSPIYNGERFEVIEVRPNHTKDFWYRIKNNSGGYDSDKEVGLEYLIRSLDRETVLEEVVYIPDKCWDGITPNYFGRDMGIFTYAYAITVWKAQGSEFDRVLYLDENVSKWADQKKFRYTGVTRAAKELIVCQ